MAKYIYIFLILIGGLAVLYSCAQDEKIPDPDPDLINEDGYMKIYLNLPDLQEPEVQNPSTKSMDDKAERMIELDKLNVLVFRNNSGTETYAYKAPLGGAVEYDTEDGTKAMITIKLVKSQAGEQYRLVFIANHDISSVPLVAGTTLKPELLEQLTYTVPGKWNAGTDNHTPFPMWGESGLLTISASMPSQLVDMYRALARIDVGLNFTSDGETLGEDAEGLNNFKLKEIKVYRTYDKGYVAPLNSSMASYTEPFIPNDAVRNGDDAPISYTIADNGGADKFVREIYIPEVDLFASPANNNVHNIVIGGYYQGSSSVTYYRLDFATEDAATGNRTFLPVLRNHRYVFNINTVRGPGFASPEAALESTATIKNINYSMIVWDETIHKMVVEGKYYFGLDKRDLQLDPQPTSLDPANSFKIKYQTNYPLSTADPLTLTWKKENPSTLFDATWDELNKEITISALTENASNIVRFDTLFVKAGPITIPVHVEQLFVNFKYTVNCESVVVNGVYKEGEALDNSHYIDLSFTAEDRTLQGKEYTFETVDLEGDHGISFSASGTFDFTLIPEGQPLTLSTRMYGTGTLINSNAGEPFKLRIISNSSSGSYCEVSIVSTDRAFNVLVMSDPNSGYGYAISRLEGGAGKVFNNPNNFGPYDYSIIKTGEFNYINASPYYDFYLTPTSNAYKWVTGTQNNGRIADIVYIAYGATFTSNTADLLVQYLDKGGVIVFFMEAAATATTLTQKILNVSNIGTQAVTASGIYPMPANSALFSDEELRMAALRKFEGDPILNGPFGDIRDKQIGEDVGSAAALTNFPVSNTNVTVYSYNNNLNLSTPITNSSAVVGFKYESESRNMFFWCDGGLMSSGITGNPNLTGYTLNPFNWNTSTGFPIAMPSYGLNPPYRFPVYNSTMFCNIMAWAVRKSQSLKTKRDSYIN